MPHLTVEYTDNLLEFDARSVLMKLNLVLVASGQFEAADIKSRAIPLDTFLVGTSPAGHAFVHIKLALLSGRLPQTKQLLSESLLLELKNTCQVAIGTSLQLCVEILDIDRASYAKATA